MLVGGGRGWRNCLMVKVCYSVFGCSVFGLLANLSLYLRFEMSGMRCYDMNNTIIEITNKIISIIEITSKIICFGMFHSLFFELQKILHQSTFRLIAF
jgi:predicted membrane protein